MKIALLGDAASIHFLRWANGLAERGIEIFAITLMSRSRGMTLASKWCVSSRRLHWATCLRPTASSASFGYITPTSCMRIMLWVMAR